MSIYKKLEKDINDIVKNTGFDDEVKLVESGRKDLGQFQINDAMNLAKKYHSNPREIAQKIVDELEKDNRFTNINIAGPGFINISLTDEYLIDLLNEMNNDIYVNIDKKEEKKIVIDYGGANVAKALHVGHLRSANIGEALKRLANTMGYNAIGDAHLGDYGRPLGLVILEISKMYPNLEYFNENYEGDYSEVELPITNSDLERIYPLASIKAKEDEEYLEEAREITRKIQNHDKGYYELWKRIIDVSKEEIKKIYDKLNVSFELWLGESDSEKYIPELEKILVEKNLLVDSEGAKIIEVAEETDKTPMPPVIYKKSNGTYTYQTTDLATILQRKKEQAPDEIWYVVDARQILHFEQIFRATRKAKLVEDNVILEHCAFGTMNGKDGKPFKTRDGGVLPLLELIELVRKETEKRINKENFTEEEVKEISEKVAIASLKYADLLPYRGTDYCFDIEKFSDIEGKTGAYILYSTIRMKSLLNKANYNNKTNSYKLNSNTEKDIILQLMNLPLVLDKALEVKSLNDIAEYIFKLTSLYNKFYAENKVITEKDEKLKESWLTLTNTVLKTNNILLDILGIEVPEKI